MAPACLAAFGDAGRTPAKLADLIACSSSLDAASS